MADPTLLEQLAYTRGHREATETLVNSLRANLAALRTEEQKRGRVARALTFPVVEAWSAKLEGFAVSLEQHLTSLRTQETQLAGAIAAAAEAGKQVIANVGTTVKRARRR